MAKEVFSIRIDSELRERLQNVADHEVRTASATIELAIKQYVEDAEARQQNQTANKNTEAMIEGKRIAKICKDNGKVAALKVYIQKLVRDIETKNVDSFFNNALQVGLLADTSVGCLIHIAESNELKMTATAFVSGLIFVNAE